MSGKYARNRRIVMRSKEPPEVRFALLHTTDHPYRCGQTLDIEAFIRRQEAEDAARNQP